MAMDSASKTATAGVAQAAACNALAGHTPQRPEMGRRTRMKLSYGVSKLKSLRMEPEQDILTCGDCQKDFLLSDIAKFIQHKINRCNKENVDPYDDNDDDDDDGDSVVSNSVISTRRTSISAPIAQRKATTPDKLSPRPGQEELDSPIQVKPDPDLRHKRPRVVDAANNTTATEPTSFMCGTCKAKLASAWELIQHAQHKHEMRLYVEDVHTTPSKSPRRSPASEDAVEKAEKMSNASDPPADDTGAHSSASSSPSQKLLAGSGRGSAAMRTPPASIGMEMLNAPPAFSIFRMPSDRPPLSSSGIGQGPFTRPLCGMDFMTPDPFHRMPSLPNLHPQGFDHQAHLPSSFTNPFERLRPPPIINPPTADGQDFYSQRLRLLAGAGPTSPTPSSPGPLNRSGKHTPPFSGPQNQQTSPHQRSSPYTGSPNERAPGADSNGKEAVLPGKMKACEFCGKQFRFQSNLIVHRRSHTGEKPFSCPLCPHACSQASKLKRHMKTHNVQMHISSSASQASSTSSDKDSAGAHSRTSTPESKSSKPEDDDETEDEEDDDEESWINEARRIGALSRDDAEEYARERAELLGEESNPADLSMNSDKKSRASLLKEVMRNTGLEKIKQYSDAFEQALKDTCSKEKPEDPLPKTRSRSDSVSDDITENGHSEEKDSNDGDKESSRMSSASQDQDNTSESSYGKRIKLEPPDGIGYPPPMESLYSRMWGFPGPFMNHHLFQNEHFPFPPVSTSENGIGHGDGFKVDGASPKASSSLSLSPGTASAPSTPTGLSGAFSRRSTSIRNDTCEFCGKVFKNCSNLTVHRRSHTGEKPYQCRLCNYACAQSSKLTRHMKTHGRYGKDVYRCKFCSMPFSVPSTLEKHMRKCVENQPNQRAALMAAASAMNPGYNHPSSSPSSV